MIIWKAFGEWGDSYANIIPQTLRTIFGDGNEQGKSLNLQVKKVERSKQNFPAVSSDLSLMRQLHKVS